MLRAANARVNRGVYVLERRPSLSSKHGRRNPKPWSQRRQAVASHNRKVEKREGKGDLKDSAYKEMDSRGDTLGYAWQDWQVDGLRL